MSVAPSVAMVIVTSIYSIVDGFFVSNFAGKSGFAAVNLMQPVMMVVAALGLMIGSGGAALVSKVRGEGYVEKANRIFAMLVRAALVLGVVLGALFAVFAPTISRLAGADEAMLRECVVYSRLCMIGMPGFVLQMAFQSFYMAAERPQLGTRMTIVAGVANIVLDALLVWGLGMGVAGAAIATSVSQVVAGFFPLFYFSSRYNRGVLYLHVLPRKGQAALMWRGGLLPYLGKACTNGLSEYVGNIALDIVSICYNLQLMRLMGEDGVAAYGVLMYISFVFAAVFIGYNIAITPIIGYHYGAGDLAEQRSLMRKSLVIIGVVGLIMTGVSELFASPLARIFVGYDAALTALTTRAIRIYMLCFLICGWSMFASALFTGLQNGVVSAAAAFARSLVFEMAAVWALPALVGIDGIWWAVNVSEVLTLLFCIFLLLRFAPQLVRRKGK